jgi:hypothetical protein
LAYGFRNLPAAFRKNAKPCCGAAWISNDATDVFPEIATRAPLINSPDCFLLAIDGKPVASPAGMARSELILPVILPWSAQPMVKADSILTIRQ